MPIPQLNPKFTKKKIGDSHTQFSHRRLGNSSQIQNKVSLSPKPKKKKGRFLYKKIPRQSGGSKLAKGLFRKFWPYILGLGFLGGIILIGMFAWYSRDLPEPGKIMDRSIALSTKIYDRTGEELLYEIHGPENRTLISIDNIPEHVINATIAIEDKNFYNHQGISIWGIIRGQIMPRLQGKRAQGGSTLTQQFVKNAILTNERRLSRKIKEWILSYQIEKKYEKRQILEFYFNEIPYGGSIYGIEAAARYYFDKATQELTIAEAAILAALPKAPTLYSPYGNNMDLLIGRQQTIINLMVDQGYISESESETAKLQELFFKKRAQQIKAPHFVMYVRELLEQKYGASIVEQSGWEIRTSLDWEAQQKAQEVIDDIVPNNMKNYEASNAALVSLDVSSGEILAMIGSKDYFDDEIDGQVNVALANRQPGSSMKPLVYLKAFEKGYRPETKIFDVVTNFAAVGDDYIPHNYDLKERGPVSIRQALAGSLNIPAVKILYLAGVYEVIDLANQFGYSTLTEPDRYGLSLVLGGAEVKLLEHVNAFATFAREGVYKESVAILEIKDSKGKILEANDNNKGRRVVDKEYTRVLNNILSDDSARAYVFGAGSRLTLPDRPVVAKTGTTNNYRDAWTIGFTPDIATGVWVGNNDNSSMKKGASGSVVAAPIWQEFMKSMTKGQPVLEFKTHDLGTCDKAMVCGQLSGSEPVKIDSMSGKLATEYTPYTTIVEKQFLEAHSILHYVNINDPLGDALSDPNYEPQYQLWEEPVLEYAKAQGYTAERPPTEYDNIHLKELQPNISWKTPNNNQTITQGRFTMSVNASAPRGVRRVEYFLDDELIGKAYSQPYNFTYQINPFISNGQHNLVAIAFDDLDNFKRTKLKVNLNIDDAARDFNLVWLEPSNGLTLKLSDLPINLSISVDRPERIDKIYFYYLSPDNQSHYFSYLSPNQNNMSISFDKKLNQGVYKFYMVVKNLAGDLITTPSIIINFED